MSRARLMMPFVLAMAAFALAATMPTQRRFFSMAGYALTFIGLVRMLRLMKQRTPPPGK